MPGFGSWEWVGADSAEFLSSDFEVRVFDDAIPPADIVVLVKFKPAIEVMRAVSSQSTIVYCPIDFYGSSDEIRSDAASLELCDLILVHAERLRPHFQPLTDVDYIDHHLKFATPLRKSYIADGPFLWVGVRSNLEPVVQWVNQNPLRGDLWILTNPEVPGEQLTAKQFGFRSTQSLRIEEWTPARQIEWTSTCRAAFDVKAEDFRSRHKPPTKAMDFLASGVPLAVAPASSSAEHLARMGFEVARLEDVARWLSVDYWNESARFGEAIAELLDRRRLRARWCYFLNAVFGRSRRI